MKLARIALASILPLAMSQAATVNFIQTSVNDSNGSVIGAVASNVYLETGISYSTVSAPSTSSSYRFTYWTNSSYPATIYRDLWGRSLNPISFVLLEDTTCTAHYLPTSQDNDGDGLPDWYEIEYFGDLTRSASHDGDGDGIQLSAEYSGGKHPLYGNSQQEGGVAYAGSGLITYNSAVYPTYTITSVPVGTVNESAVVPPGTLVTTPDLSANSSFGYWTLDGVRQVDAWGVALSRITFTMGSVNRAAVAYLFAGDTESDGVPDAYEQYYYGTLANGATSDTDGDGISLLAERNGGMNPLYANAHQEGGVSFADSAMVTVNLAGFSRYTLASDPSGTVNQSAIVPDGTVVTSPNMTQASFGYWELDGVPQRDAWGAALRQITFTMDGADRTAVARLYAADTDTDGINDGFEMYHFGTLANGASYDGDGDGINLLGEYTAGSNPVFGNFHQEGGVSWADSEMVVVNLQPYERLGKVKIGGVLTDFFSPDPDMVTGMQAGTWSSTAVTDWDGDGDLDLFVAHESGLRVFRNIGTPHNPNFEEVTTGFGSLTAYVTSINRPSLCGGDWNGDGLGDLVIGGETGNLRFIASGGSFSSNGNGPDLATGSTRSLPALGDMNGDGKADLIVLLDDGTTRLYLNDSQPMPFTGPGANNFLGVLAPAGTSIAIGDINQDGLNDVLLADNEGRIWEFINNGSGGFSLQSKVWGGSYPGFAAGLTLAAADLEGDGDLDLIGGLANGGVIALRDPSVGRPTGLVARPGADSIQLDWDANWQSRIRGYYVYRGTAEEGPFGRLLPDYIPLPGYLDSVIDPAVPSYYYYVTGVSQFFLPGNSTPRISESLPSDLAVTQAGKVVLSVKPARANPGQRLRLNLSIENATGVSGNGMQLRIAYDPAKLQPWAQASPGGDTVISSGLSRNLVFTDNGAAAAGELIIDGTGGQLEPGSGTLFTLQFEVDASVIRGTPMGVTITGGTMRDLDGIPLILEILPTVPPESGDTYIPGDVDGDGLVANADLDLLKQLIKPNSSPPTAEQLMAGDLNGDGKLDAKDLVLMMQLLSAP